MILGLVGTVLATLLGMCIKTIGIQNNIVLMVPCLWLLVYLASRAASWDRVRMASKNWTEINKPAMKEN